MADNPRPALMTFLIADVRGYTRFTVEHGDEAAVRLVTAFAQLASSSVAPHGGRVVELRGDEALVAFPSARDALRCSILLQERFTSQSSGDLPLRVGIGIDAGEAIPVDDGYRGAALNLAARLCGLAGPGEVLASETVTKLAGRLDGLSYLERGTTELKGFASKVMVMQILPETGLPVTVPKEAELVEEQRLPIGGFLGALPSNRLVERRGELDRLLGAVHVVQGGEGRMLLLTGEPGVGKTRLAQEATLAVRNLGFLVASGRCYEPEQSVPYYPFREALEMLYDAAPGRTRSEARANWPDLLQLLPHESRHTPHLDGEGQEEQHRLFYAVTGFIDAVSASRPIALLIDDLQWADGSSLKLLQYIARHTRSCPVFLLGTYRDVEVGRRHPLEAALRDLNREGLTKEIAVRRLDRDGTAALTASTFGESEVSAEFAELLHRHTEGNPFFTHEVLRALVERGDIYEENGRWERRGIQEIEVPRSVRSAVGERISRLEEAAQELLAEASVFGPTFLFDDLEALGGHSEQAIEEALDAAASVGLVRLQGPDRYVFNHALTQQVLYEEISPRRRRRLHLAAARAIEAGTHAERRVADLAWHFLNGDDPEKAFLYSKRAGDEAEEIFAHSEAERHYRTSVELARELGDSRGEMEALERLGLVLSYTGPFDEAIEHLKKADRLAVTLGDREVQRGVMALAFDLAGIQHLADEEITRRFDELLQDTEPSAGLARMYLRRSNVVCGEGRYDEGGELAAKAAEVARTIGSDYLLANAEMRVGTATAHNDIHAGIAILERAADLAERTGNLFAQSVAINNLAFQYMLLGDLERNLSYRTRSYELGQKQQSPLAMAWGSAMVSQAYLYLGDLGKAREFGETALEVVRRMERIWHTSYALLALAHLQVQSGHFEEAESLVEEGLAVARSFNDPQGIAYGEGISGELLLLRGDFATVAARYGEQHEPQFNLQERPVMAEALVCAGRLEEASHIAEEMVANDRLARSAGLRVQGMLAMNSGGCDEAREKLEEALALARRQRYRLEEGRILHEMGRVFVECGDIGGGVARLEEARLLFRQMGAYAYAERTERAIADLPSRK